jgi:hypothetical protein
MFLNVTFVGATKVNITFVGDPVMLLSTGATKMN